MGIRINTNISSINTQRHLLNSTNMFAKSMEKLSSGLRINRAGDDAAGLAISEGLKSDIRALDQAGRNAADGIALLQIAEGAANEISSMLQRMRELAVQSSNDTLTSTERTYTNQEYQALMSEIDRVTSVTQYNSQTLLTGTTDSFGGLNSASSVLHIGPNSSATNTLSISLVGTSTGAIQISNSAITTQASAGRSIASIDIAIGSINAMRSNIGAYVNRLEHAINNLDNQMHNTQSAESLIRDVDFAAETTTFTRNQIMVQSATAMLAQANTVPQTILTLLR